MLIQPGKRMRPEMQGRASLHPRRRTIPHRGLNLSQENPVMAPPEDDFPGDHIDAGP